MSTRAVWAEVERGLLYRLVPPRSRAALVELRRVIYPPVPGLYSSGGPSPEWKIGTVEGSFVLGVSGHVEPVEARAAAVEHLLDAGWPAGWLPEDTATAPAPFATPGTLIYLRGERRKTIAAGAAALRLGRVVSEWAQKAPDRATLTFQNLRTRRSESTPEEWRRWACAVAGWCLRNRLAVPGTAPEVPEPLRVAEGDELQAQAAWDRLLWELEYRGGRIDLLNWVNHL